MTPERARLIIGNRFDDERDTLKEGAWWHSEDGETYLALFDLLLLKMPAADALSILAQAHCATANEYGD